MATIALPMPMVYACSCVSGAGTETTAIERTPDAAICCRKCVAEHPVAVQPGCHCCDNPGGCDCDACACQALQTPFIVPDARRILSLLDDLQLENARQPAALRQEIGPTADTVLAPPPPPLCLAGGPDAQTVLCVWTL